MHALALALVLTSAPKPAVIEDDYGRALVEAKRSRRLLFVDAWAPWCHTCVFMREHVLNQPSFAAFERDVVFAAIDTEKASSAAFLDKFPVSVWPTLFFIDPATEAVAFKWVGSADAAQMRALLDAARRKDERLSEADALWAQGKATEAALKYVDGLAGDPSVRGTLSMLSALSAARQLLPCARTAAEQAPRLEAASDRINAITWGLGCALELEAGSQDKAPLTAALARQASDAVSLEGALADDVSGLYELLVEERRAAKDDPAAEALARRWLAYLEAAAGAARTPSARAVFDPHRLVAAMASKQVERVLAPLEQSERQLPKDFNPSARLAIAFRELKRLPQAEAAIARALARNTGGPRRVRLFEIRASIAAAKGDVAGQRRALSEALSYGRALPASQRPTRALAALEQQLRDLEPAATK
ncbi:MAG: thioredoxin family protein [Myxococcaceae bacterium]|nr:thioredoxin family protein [Myxococcaceae bacterium]